MLYSITHNSSQSIVYTMLMLPAASFWNCGSDIVTCLLQMTRDDNGCLLFPTHPFLSHILVSLSSAFVHAKHCHYRPLSPRVQRWRRNPSGCTCKCPAIWRLDVPLVVYWPVVRGVSRQPDILHGIAGGDVTESSVCTPGIKPRSIVST